MVNPSRVAFSVFGKDIYWYGVLIAISVILAIVLATREARRKGINPDLLLDFALLAIPFGIIGARLYYVVFSWEQFAGDFWRVFAIWEGGLAIYGVIIGGVAAALIFCKWKKMNVWTLLDLAAPGIVLGQAIGRWGNFFNQEAYGPLVTDPAWMWFPFAVKIDATNTIHMATFFYESVWCFAVFIFLMTFRHKFKRDGDVFLWYILLYALERMLIEGLRQDSLWLIPGAVRVSQLLSFLIFAAVLAFMIVRRVKERKNPAAALECNLGCGCETDCDECETGCVEEAPQAGEKPEGPEADGGENSAEENEPNE